MSLIPKRIMSINATLSTINIVELSDFNKKTEQKTNKNAQQNTQTPDNHLNSVNKNMKKEAKNNKKPEITSENNVAQVSQKAQKPRVPISKLSLLAITLTIALGGFVYFHGHQQLTQQKQTINQLHSEIDALKQALQQKTDIATVNQTLEQQNHQLAALQKEMNQQIDAQRQSQQQLINTVKDSLKITEQNLINFNEQLSAMSKTDNSLWLISQANYLIHLAGRKIWSDQDYVTARLLLKSADSSLAQANDPSLLPVRQAINKDIAALAQISYTDLDGIVMTIMGLSDSITELPLNSNYQSIDLGLTLHDDTITNDLKKDETQSQADGWLDNLTASSKSFLKNFIQIEKYDDYAECLSQVGKNSELIEKCKVYQGILAPEQSLYLRENIRLRLFIAAQAVPKHQDIIYLQTLNDVSIWVRAYFDISSVKTKVFLNELAELQHQSISNQNIPEKLASSDEIKKLMQTRVYSTLVH